MLPVGGWEIVVAGRDAINDNASLDIVGRCRNKGVVDTCTVCVGLNEVATWLTGVVLVWLTLGGDVYEGDSHSRDSHDREKL